MGPCQTGSSRRPLDPFPDAGIRHQGKCPSEELATRKFPRALLMKTSSCACHDKRLSAPSRKPQDRIALAARRPLASGILYHCVNKE